MADNWTTLTDETLTAGKPITFEQGRAFRDNPEAIAAGNPLAPNISPAALRWVWDDIYYDSGTHGSLTALGNGAFQWTAPTGCTAILIEAIGGGGGGGAGQYGDYGGPGANGGNTSFAGAVIGAGGGGATGYTPFTAAAGSGAAVSSEVDDGVQGSGGGGPAPGGNTPTPSGAGGALELGITEWLKGGESATTALEPGSGGQNFGAGGGGGAGSLGNQGHAGGGAGSYGRVVRSVTPGTSYSVQIGKGGSGGGRWNGGATTYLANGGTHRAGGAGSIYPTNEAVGGGGGGAGYMRIWRRVEV